ncbi:MAG: sec-independent protein translocase protein TatB [Halieaceae bacterium]
MFDIGFAELLLVAIVGLLVLGPERLPVAVRTVSLWLRQLRRSFNSIKSEIERELNAEEFKQQLHNDTILESFRDAGADLKESLNGIGEELPDTPYDVSDILSAHSADKVSQPDESTTEVPPPSDSPVEELPTPSSQ